MLAETTGRVAVVTGAGGGIGAAIATCLATAGMRIVIHYRSSADNAEQVAAHIIAAGGEAVTIAADLAEADGVRELFSKTTAAFGGVDVLINNAGSYPNQPLLEMSLDDWRTMYRDNVESTFLCTQQAALQMRERGGGAIVNVVSTSALNPGSDHSHYNSAKAAVVMFTQSAAQELGAHGIRVNAVAPGLVYRPGLEQQWPDGYARYCEKAPLGCVVQPEDVANACLFLSSDNACRISGATLPVDAGVLSAMIY